MEKFGIYDLNIDGYNEQDDRFILPVYGPVGFNRRGCIAYSLSGAEPKALTYNETPLESSLHSPGPVGRSIVIVEDWWSAEKVEQSGGCGVALLGTNLDQAAVSELVEFSNGPTFIALDRDAYTKTLLYLSRYREQFPRGLYAWSLKQDLKYESEERIKEALDGNYDFTSDAKRQGSL
jgi:hypothetical protein